MERPDAAGEHGIPDGIRIDAGELADGLEIRAALLDPLPRFKAWIIRPAVPPIFLRVVGGPAERVENCLPEHAGPKRLFAGQLHDQRFLRELRSAAIRSCPEQLPALPRNTFSGGASGRSCIPPSPISTETIFTLCTVRRRPA